MAQGAKYRCMRHRSRAPSSRAEALANWLALLAILALGIVLPGPGAPAHGSPPGPCATGR
jgi:hypothetical protein